MIVVMKCLNEDKTVKRCIADFHNESWVEDIIVIDGGSTDSTVYELKQFEKVRVYTHPWLDWYHDMEVSQSNIAMSYVPIGGWFFILDFDERMSDELKSFFVNFDFTKVASDVETVHFSRRTCELMRHEDSPFTMYDEEGWPIISYQIGQYPDYQCRLIKRKVTMKWANSPHHVLVGQTGGNINLDYDILHFEKDDFRDRVFIERKWARAQASRKELGLRADLFECDVKPELVKYTNPETWR